jgi:hypothetical protein
MTRKEPLAGKYAVIDAHVDIAAEIRPAMPRSSSLDRKENTHFSGGKAFGTTGDTPVPAVPKKKNYFEILDVNHDCSGDSFHTHRALHFVLLRARHHIFTLKYRSVNFPGA